MPSNAEVAALADAMWQLLDDMGERGLTVCLAAKAQARLAYEPFARMEDPELVDGFMSVEMAQKIEADSA